MFILCVFQAVKLLGLKSQTLASERDQLREARPALLQRAAQLRLELEDAEARVASDSSAASGREKELREVESKIAAAEKSLAALDAKLAKARRLEKGPCFQSDVLLLF